MPKQKPRKRTANAQKAKKVSHAGLQKCLARLKRIKAFSNMAENPIRFRTATGTKVVVLRHGFSNIYKGQKNVPARVLVIAFINGKKLFFYRSSGETSTRQGQWFPTQGPELGTRNSKVYAGTMAKMEGHPKQRGSKGNPRTVREMKRFRKRPYFPKEISEIMQQIKKMERGLKLHNEWDLKQYIALASAFKELPFTKKIKPE